MKNTRKFISTLCALAIILIATTGGITLAHAGTMEEECNLVFRTALEDILKDEAVTAPTITVMKEPIYDLSLKQLGFLYLMRYDGNEGYALVINTDGTFGTSEFYMDGKNPYAKFEGQNIYVQQFVYFVYQDGLYIDTDSGAIIDETIIESLKVKSFSSSGVVTGGSESIQYVNRTANTYQMTYRHPAYTPTNLTNACVPAAGGNVIGFWTRYYPGLIPGFSPGSIQFGQYIYKEFSTDVIPMLENLYNLMGTNTNGAGTSIPQFLSGMNSYISGKGYGISYDSTMTGGSFNYGLTKQKLESGLPLVLFVDLFKVDSFIQSTNSVTVNYIVATAPHAMAGFGYNEITYTFANGTSRTDTYIQVATGLGMQTKGYYNIYYNTQIDECYAITIY